MGLGPWSLMGGALVFNGSGALVFNGSGALVFNGWSLGV